MVGSRSQPPTSLSLTDLCTCGRVREFAPSTDEKWVEEFESEIASKNKQLADVAKEMTETVSDPEIKETEVQTVPSGGRFLKFYCLYSSS